MNKIRFVASLCLSMLSLFSFANIQPKQVVTPEKVIYSKYSSIPSTIYFSQGKELELSQVTSFLANYFEGNQVFSLRLVGQQSDELGFVHYRYQQVLDNIPVSYAYYVVHAKDNKVLSMNGLLFDLIGSSSFSLNAVKALENAKEFVSAKEYMWENLNEEQLLKRQTNNQQSTYLPSPQLIYVTNPSKLEDPIRLGYKVTIYASQPLSKQDVFVDAVTGKIIYTENLLHFKDVKGKANTVYSGVQTITTDSTSSGYTLKESGRGNGIETYNMMNGTSFSSYQDFIDKNNIWDTVNAQKDQYAIDAHWGAEMTYDYYFKKHNRNSIDNNGYKLVNMVHYGSAFGNAYWDGTRMIFGDGDGTNTLNPLVSLDIIGHEITHGLTANTAKLVSQNEPGALNESFSDIFGATIDWFTRPDKANWKVGDEISSIYRSMEDPNSTNHPDTYQGNHWITINGSDFGGVHSNNGVQNYWYYLLVQGGNGVNDKGDGYNVTGIGIDNAAAIVYRNLTVYMTSLSNFQDARFYSIQAAIDLFGSCSPIVESVVNAWYAVGVGESYNSKITAKFNPDYDKNCNPYKVKFINSSSANNSNSYLWSFDDGSTSIEVNPIHTYTQPGNYIVKLIVKSKDICVGKDSIDSTLAMVEFKSPQPIIIKACKKDTLLTLKSTLSNPYGWYISDSSNVILDTLENFSFKNPLKDTNFFLKSRRPDINKYWKVGLTDLKNNVNYLNATNRFQIFDVKTPVTLKSVLVNASGAGIRIIELRDDSGKILESKSVNLNNGENRVELNLELPQGNNFQLGLGGTMGNLLRTNAGVKYPYEIENVLSVKGSNASNGFGLSYYYFFYDWEVVTFNCKEITQEYKVIQSECTTSGIDLYSMNLPKIFPNPTTGNVKISNIGGRTLKILDLVGNVLFENNCQSEQLDVNLASWSTGVYIIELTSVAGIDVVRLIKE